MTAKPSEFGVREGDTQTAMTYLFLLAWRDGLMDRLRWAEGVLPTRHYAEFIETHRPWRREAEQCLEEMTFCANLLGDTARDLHNLWEDARAERELEIKKAMMLLILEHPVHAPVTDGTTIYFTKGNK